MKQRAMKGYAMQGIGKTGWIEKEVPACGPIDAICRPIAVAPCTSDVHTVWAGAIGNRKDLILGHEAVAEVVEVGELVKEFRPGDRVIVPAITPVGNLLKPSMDIPSTAAICWVAGSSLTVKTEFLLNSSMSMKRMQTCVICQRNCPLRKRSCFAIW